MTLAEPVNCFVTLTKESKTTGTISLDDIEPISNSTFRTLLAENPIIIIGEVHTRDRVDFRKRYIHYYFGPNLIKILFSTLQMPNEQILRSRYHS
jgi:hypothetical protein